MDWASLAGSAIGAGVSYFGQSQANRENVDQAREQRAWLERMSDTAHQREVNDLRKAGLNPILSAGGSGASTPGITMPTIQSTAEQAGKTISDAAAQATQVRAQAKQAENTAKDTEVKAATKKLVEAQATGAQLDNMQKALGGSASNMLLPFVKQAAQGLQALQSGASKLFDQIGDAKRDGKNLFFGPAVNPNFKLIRNQR